MKLDDFQVVYNGAECDDRPGAYYVSVVDAGRFGLVAGPYDTHRAALDDVNKARKVACKADGYAWFYGWGTVRLEASVGLGVLNKRGLI